MPVKDMAAYMRKRRRTQRRARMSVNFTDRTTVAQPPTPQPRVSLARLRQLLQAYELSRRAQLKAQRQADEPRSVCFGDVYCASLPVGASLFGAINART